MEASSIIEDRAIEGITLGLPEEEFRLGTLTGAEKDQWSIAFSLLTILQTIFDLKLPVNELVWPVQHFHILGEGATFSVRCEHASNTEHPGSVEVVKVSKQSYNTSLSGTFNKVAVRALLSELKVYGNPETKGHANIVQLEQVKWAITSVLPLSFSPTLSVEYAQHGTLADFEQTHGDLPYSARKQLALDVSRGLGALHRASIIHGDVKAENVLIFDGIEVGSFIAKVSDFGCALTVEKPGNENDLPTGMLQLPATTPPWHAPEALKPIAADDIYFTDVFSFGLLCWRLMIMRHPAELYDLPLETELRLEEFRKIVLLPNIRLLIPRAIELEADLQDIDEILRVNAIFNIALDPMPRKRQLSEIVTLLSSAEPFRTWARSLQSRRPENSMEHLVNNLSLRDAASQNESCSANSTLFSPQVLRFPPVRRVALSGLQRKMIPHRLWPVVIQALSMSHKVLTKDSPSLTDLEIDTYRSVSWLLCWLLMFGMGCTKDLPGGICILKQCVVATGLAKDWVGSAVFLSLCMAHWVRLLPETADNIIGMTRRMTQKLRFPLYRLSLFHSESKGDLLRKIVGKDLKTNYPEFSGLLEESHDSRSIPLNKSVCDASVEPDLLNLDFLADIKRLRDFLGSGDADVNVTNSHGDTPVLIACRGGKYEAAMALLENGCDAAIENCDCENGLHWLSWFRFENRKELALALWRGGAAVYPLRADDALKAPILDEEKYIMRGYIAGSAIMRAVAFNDLVSFRILWSFMMIDAAQNTFPSSWTLMIHFYQPLHLAFLLNCEEIAFDILDKMEKLLPALADDITTDGATWIAKYLEMINCPNLFPAVIDSNWKLARVALHGPWTQSAREGCLRLLKKYDIYTKNKLDPSRLSRILAYTVGQDDNEALEDVLQDADVREHVNDVCTDLLGGLRPIDLTLLRGKVETFKTLVDAGAILDLRQSPDPRHLLARNRQSYLHMCANERVEDLEFAQIILASGEDLDRPDADGLTPLFRALLKANFPLARLLIERGANVNAMLGESDEKHGRTNLGLLLDQYYGCKCDDQVESIRFLLSFTELDKKPSFCVSTSNSTAFTAAAYNPLAGPSMQEVFTLLLSHFSHSTYIDQRPVDADGEEGITAIQYAILGYNDAAVRMLINAGADLSIIGLYNDSLLDLAIQNFRDLQPGFAKMPRILREENIRRCQDIITAISQAAQWPAMEQRSEVLTELLSESKQLVDIMMELSHSVCEVLRLDDRLYALVTKHMDKLSIPDESDMQRRFAYLEDTRQQLNGVTAPIFRAELRFAMFLRQDVTSEASGSSNQRIVDQWKKTIKKLPLLKSLPHSDWSHLRQASIFERLLEAERQIPLNLEAPVGASGFGLFARSAKPEDLPYPHQSVEYAMSLLGCWTKFFKNDTLYFESETDVVQVLRFIKILRMRGKQQRDGESLLEAFSLDFTTFHFRDLLGLEEEAESMDLGGALELDSKCRCMRRRIGRVTFEQVAKESEELSGPGVATWQHEPWNIDDSTFNDMVARKEARKRQSELKQFVIESNDFLQNDEHNLSSMAQEYFGILAKSGAISTEDTP